MTRASWLRSLSSGLVVTAALCASTACEGDSAVFGGNGGDNGECRDREDGAPCGDASEGPCDMPDTCLAGSCVSNSEPDGTPCGDPNVSDCHALAACDGAGVCVDVLAQEGTPCGDQTASACSDPDTCDAAGECLQNHLPMGAVCGDGTAGECSAPDSCDGEGACASNHLPAATACGDQADTPCSNPDSCDGMGSCDENNEPMGTACGDASDDDCLNPDGCDGTGVCLANDELDSKPCSDCPSPPCAGCLMGACIDACTAASPLASTFAGGNGQNGAMFDIVALNQVNISSFDAHLLTGAHSIEIYFVAGGYGGHESNPNAWTLVGSAANVNGNGFGIATPIPIPINVTIPQGQTYGFYVTVTNNLTLRYTNGFTEGGVLVADSNIQVLEGRGVVHPFGLSFTPRDFNGVVHYQLCQ